VDNGDQFVNFESFEKTGEGTLTAQDDWLFGVDGEGRVSEGTLALQNALFEVGTLTVAGGATLAGNGTVTGDVIGEAGATIGPGFSPGTLTIEGALDLTGGGLLEVEIESASVFDSFIVGDLRLDGGEVRFLLEETLSMSDLMASDLGLESFFSFMDGSPLGDLNPLFGDTMFSLGTDGRLFDLDFTDETFSFARTTAQEVPVPASWLSLLSGLLGLSFLRRLMGDRRRKGRHRGDVATTA